MKTILDFKKGDILTRVEQGIHPYTYEKDSSWMGDKLEYMELSGNIFVFRNHTMGYERHLNLNDGFWWLGWDYFTKDVIEALLLDAKERNMLGLINKYEQSIRQLSASLITDFYIVK